MRGFFIFSSFFYFFEHLADINICRDMSHDKMRVVMALMVMMMVTVAMMELKITVMMMILWKGCALVTLTQLCCVVNYP